MRVAAAPSLTPVSQPATPPPVAATAPKRWAVALALIIALGVGGYAVVQAHRAAQSHAPGWAPGLSPDPSSAWVVGDPTVIGAVRNDGVTYPWDHFGYLDAVPPGGHVAMVAEAAVLDDYHLFFRVVLVDPRATQPAGLIPLRTLPVAQPALFERRWRRRTGFENGGSGPTFLASSKIGPPLPIVWPDERGETIELVPVLAPHDAVSNDGSLNVLMVPAGYVSESGMMSLGAWLVAHDVAASPTLQHVFTVGADSADETDGPPPPPLVDAYGFVGQVEHSQLVGLVAVDQPRHADDSVRVQLVPAAEAAAGADGARMLPLRTWLALEHQRAWSSVAPDSDRDLQPNPSAAASPPSNADLLASSKNGLLMRRGAPVVTWPLTPGSLTWPAVAAMPMVDLTAPYAADGSVRVRLLLPSERTHGHWRRFGDWLAAGAPGPIEREPQPWLAP